MPHTKNMNITHLLSRCFDNNHPNAWDALWRQSAGSRSKAIMITKTLIPHYTNEKINEDTFEEDFDFHVAEYFGGGAEIEWVKI
jgi:hypothetical protein